MNTSESLHLSQSFNDFSGINTTEIESEYPPDYDLCSSDTFVPETEECDLRPIDLTPAPICQAEIADDPVQALKSCSKAPMQSCSKAPTSKPPPSCSVRSARQMELRRRRLYQQRHKELVPVSGPRYVVGHDGQYQSVTNTYETDIPEDLDIDEGAVTSPVQMPSNRPFPSVYVMNNVEFSFEEVAKLFPKLKRSYMDAAH